MFGRILEINQSKKYAGRTNIKWILLEIHESTDKWNKNGITWLEKYVQNNLDSIKGMPVAAQFLDSWEKDEPFGHGLSEIKDNEPLFEDSEVVGSAERGYVDTIELNGEQKRVVIAEGYLYHQRYPKFVKWLKSEMYDDKKPDTSIEICAQDGQDYITYESGWKEEGRVPMVFDFSGSAILGIAPADDSAVLLELNQKKGDKKMSDNNKEIIVELNNKLDTKNTEINELKDSLKNKESELEGVQTELNSKKEELNATIESKKEVETELNELKTAKEELDKQLSELNEFKKGIEDEKLKAEFNSKMTQYTDEEKEVAKETIAEFNEAPSKEKMTSVVSEINSAIAQKLLENRKNNNQPNNADDIFGDIVETNNDNSYDDLF